MTQFHVYLLCLCVWFALCLNIFLNVKALVVIVKSSWRFVSSSRSSCPILLVQFNIVRGCHWLVTLTVSSAHTCLQWHPPVTMVTIITPIHGTSGRLTLHTANLPTRKGNFVNPNTNLHLQHFNYFPCTNDLSLGIWQFENLHPELDLVVTIAGGWSVSVSVCKWSPHVILRRLCLRCWGWQTFLLLHTPAPEMVMVISNLCYVIHRSAEIGDFVCIRKWRIWIGIM